MVIIRVHCCACGGVWDVYSKLREYDASRVCPHCESRIEGATWREKVLPAFDAVRNANVTLTEDHYEYHTARFEVDFISDATFENAKK